MVARITSPVAGHPIGASRELKGMVGGKTFKSVAAFETKIGKNGAAILPPGQSVKIHVGKMSIGGPFPHITGLNQNSAFTVKLDTKGNMVITAKKTAEYGATDNVRLDHGSPVVQHPKPAMTFPFKLTVGSGHIMMG